jgi:hypothetical protein
MAEVLDHIIRKLKEYREDIIDITVEVLNENASLIEDMNIAQLQRGERADGQILPNYSPVSVLVYGKPPGPIKLFDTGAFYRGIIARANPKGLEMDNTDSKIGKLANRYGDEIIGLQEQNIELVQEFILIPELIKKTEQRLLQ